MKCGTGRYDTENKITYLFCMCDARRNRRVTFEALYHQKHVNLELNLDEFDLTAAESKATYEEIIKYVSENFGLKVSNLNIAQVKRKYGIIERSNYNLPKSENSKQPQCTAEKEKAIVEAFKHFKML